MSKILQVEAAIAEAIIETNDKEFASKLGLFLADHPGLIGRAAIEAMREPTERMCEAADWTQQSEVKQYQWAIDAALIWPAGSADIAGVPLARD